MGQLIGIDIGGTFTDLFAVDDSGLLREAKVPSTARPTDGILAGLAELGVELNRVERLAHGTTIATNALVEKRGARSALVTTSGFRDQLEIRRTNKGDLYDLAWRPPKPIVRRANRLEVRERVLVDGSVERAPEPEDIERIIRIVRKREIESIGIVFLHSYVNAAHEQEVKEQLAAALPDVYIAASSDVVQEYREFERTATIAANVYVAPVMSRYLAELQSAMRDRGLGRDVVVMQSNGGLASLETVREVPARTVASGPAAGAIAMAYLAEQTGHPNLVGLDIGGTTADVSVVWKGEPRWDNRTVVEFGLPILFPAIEIVSIGAGGGTMAWIDAAGKLRMGPASAGARPGPACYDAGGTEPTSTDAQVVLGRLDPRSLLAGRLEIDPELAAQAIEERVATPLGLGLHEAAHGMIRIMTDTMMRTMRLVSVERGHDPRDFALCAFGGGGPMYAPDLARELGIPRVIVPPVPGVFSAYGMLAADMVEDASRSVILAQSAIEPERLEQQFAELEERILARYRRDGVALEEVDLQRHAEIAYAGQTHATTVSLLPDRPIDDEVVAAMIATFHTLHERRFRHSDPDSPIELMHLRVFGRHHLRKPIVSADAIACREDAPRGATRPVYFEAAGGLVETPIHQRSDLVIEQPITGPAIIEQLDATTVIGPGMTAHRDEAGNLIIDVGGAATA